MVSSGSNGSSQDGKMEKTMTNTATHKVQLVNMTDGSVCGHKAGCSDLKKLAVRHDVHGVDEIATKHDAWLDYNADFLAEGSGAYDIDWKACANHIPAGEPDVEADPEVEVEAKKAGELNRKACVASLKAAGYEGPTSFLMPVLRELTALVVAGVSAEEALKSAKEGRKLR